jgi:ABC-type transport system involved in multi-copper enzyme maturation permease subunit
LLLAAALFIGGFLWCAILYLRFEVFKHPKGLGDFWDIFLGTWLFLLVIYSGALWTVLLLRQMAAAFWFTLLVPVAILVVIANLVKNDNAGMIILCIVFALYSITGFLFARRLFLRAQDVQWTGGTISLPAWLGFGTRIQSSVATPDRKPLRALIRKELQFQQVSLLFAGVLAVLYLLLIIVLSTHTAFANASADAALSFFWVMWLIMPVLVGSMAVAEERRLGTLEAHLCLPVTRRIQLLIKFVVALMLGILLGALLPWALEEMTASMGASVNVREGIFGVTYLGSTLVARVVFAGILVVLSFYASTLARNMLHALPIALILTLVSGFILIPIGLATERDFFLRNPVRFWAYLIGLPVLLTALIWLGQTNYKRLLEDWRVWRRNLIAMAASLIAIIVAANAIYYRAWELVLPLEPRHGPPRLMQSQPVTLEASGRPIAVHLPDGRVWLDPIDAVSLHIS